MDQRTTTRPLIHCTGMLTPHSRASACSLPWDQIICQIYANKTNYAALFNFQSMVIFRMNTPTSFDVSASAVNSLRQRSLGDYNAQCFTDGLLTGPENLQPTILSTLIALLLAGEPGTHREYPNTHVEGVKAKAVYDAHPDHYDKRLPPGEHDSTHGSRRAAGGSGCSRGMLETHRAHILQQQAPKDPVVVESFDDDWTDCPSPGDTGSSDVFDQYESVSTVQSTHGVADADYSSIPQQRASSLYAPACTAPSSTIHCQIHFTLPLATHQTNWDHHLWS